MTPRDLLQQWLDLSENRALSVERFCERRGRLQAKTGLAVDACFSQRRPGEIPIAADLLSRWRKLSSMRGPEAYWTARKSLERETRAYLETDDGKH